MTKRKLGRADLDALDRRRVGGVYYPPDQDRPQLTTARKPKPTRKGRRSR
jgi:hypothetical protein